MSVTLKYRVLNSSVAPQQREVEVDGQTGVLTVNRLLVDLLPVDHTSGSIRVDLPPETPGFDEDAEFILSLKPVKKGS